MASEVKLPRLGQGMESGTIVRWSLGTLAAGASGSVTITARAGAITSGTEQIFTNTATLSGKDSGGTPYDVDASADVTVQALDTLNADTAGAVALNPSAHRNQHFC